MDERDGDPSRGRPAPILAAESGEKTWVMIPSRRLACLCYLGSVRLPILCLLFYTLLRACSDYIFSHLPPCLYTRLLRFFSDHGWVVMILIGVSLVRKGVQELREFTSIVINSDRLTLKNRFGTQHFRWPDIECVGFASPYSRCTLSIFTPDRVNINVGGFTLEERSEILKRMGKLSHLQRMGTTAGLGAIGAPAHFEWFAASTQLQEHLVYCRPENIAEMTERLKAEFNKPPELRSAGPLKGK